MTGKLALLAAAVSLAACGTTPGATAQYRSSAGYTISYPSTWKVTANSSRTFGASAPDRKEYLVVMLLDAPVSQVLSSHQDQLSRVSDQTQAREAAEASAGAPELWSRRTEKDGRVGIYQQYFFSTSRGTVWIQHGCFEPGPDLNEAADRDCDDAGRSIASSFRMST